MPMLHLRAVAEEEEAGVPCAMPTAAIAPCLDLHPSLANLVAAAAVLVCILPFHHHHYQTLPLLLRLLVPLHPLAL